MSPKIFFTIMKKLGSYVIKHIWPYMCTKDGNFSLKFESRYAKIDQLIKRSIKRIFNNLVPNQIW